MLNCNIITCFENLTDEMKKINTENSTYIDNCSLTTHKYDFLSKCVEIYPKLTDNIDYKC